MRRALWPVSPRTGASTRTIVSVIPEASASIWRTLVGRTATWSRSAPVVSETSEVIVGIDVATAGIRAAKVGIDEAASGIGAELAGIDDATVRSGTRTFAFALSVRRYAMDQFGIIRSFRRPPPSERRKAFARKSRPVPWRRISPMHHPRSMRHPLLEVRRDRHRVASLRDVPR